MQIYFQTKFLPDDSNFGRFLDRLTDFNTADDPKQIIIVFGMNKQDLSNCHKTDADCFGDTVWYDLFNLNNHQAQEDFMVR